ncbi:MAG: GNAT family N-acetyltransferase [Candidatus Methanoplasma sp.]|jgi:ribosomal protein S18 acetylase RimI-like enzyme|nr:GNAT family N-acetyltransferase [Candidatus Methanoplasma sp.]
MATVSELEGSDIKEAAAVLSQGFKEKMACLKLDVATAAGLMVDSWETGDAHRYLIAKEEGRIVGVIHLKVKGTETRGASFSVLLKKYGFGAARRFRTGMSALREKVPEGDCYIAMISVAEDQRGKGIATELLRAAKEFVVTKGYRRLTLYVSKDNEAASKAYLKFGFKIMWETNNVAERIIFGVPHWYFMVMTFRHEDKKDFFLHGRF